MRRILLILVLAAAAAAAETPAPTYKAGLAQRAFLRDDAAYDWRGSKTHALECLMWYPADADAEEKPQWVGNPPHAFASMGMAAPGAPLAPGPAKFPLILLSHGTGGSAAMMAWLGTELARQGYIAIAVNHPGNNALGGYTVQGFTLGWERAVDLSRVLDGILADPEFGPRIDPRRVGAAGFSLGGYTMIRLAGGTAEPLNVDRLAEECSKPGMMDLLCYDPPEFPDLRKQATALAHSDAAYTAALEASAKSHRDPRVRAVFAIAPVDLHFTPESLKAIRIPVALVVGGADPIAVPAYNAEILAKEIPGAALRILPGGVQHYTFLDTCTDEARRQQTSLCADSPGVDRDSVHREVAAQAVEFFARTLARETK